MSRQSPLNPLHQQAEASFLMYGTGPDAASGAPIPIVETFGELEAEYAAIRKGCILLDLPHRAAIRITGKDRLDFLGRMITQETKNFAPCSSRNAFWLNRKGRIDADLRLTQFETELWVDTDILAAKRTVDTLTEFVFSEDITLTDNSESMHRLALHGPRAAALLQSLSTPIQGPALDQLQPDQAATISISGRTIIIDRDDITGDPGFNLLLNIEDVPHIYEQLLDRGLSSGDPHNSDPNLKSFRLRTAGWHAFNIARIEAGRPLYNIDFGPQSFPHECAAETLKNRVSFTKGCYLGQEIVARMQSLGHPKQMLVGILFDESPTTTSTPNTPLPIPVAATPVFPVPLPEKPGGGARGGLSMNPKSPSHESSAPPITPEPKPLGAITSSTRSPMRSDQAIAFAQVKWESTKPGTRVTVPTDGGPMQGTIRDSLTFWKRT